MTKWASRASVEAVKLEIGALLPDWTLKAIADGRICPSPGGVNQWGTEGATVLIGQPRPFVIGEGKDCRIGDYITYSENGDLDVVSHDVFLRDYETA